MKSAWKFVLAVILMGTVCGVQARADWWGHDRGRRDRHHNRIIRVLPREAHYIIVDGTGYWVYAGNYYTAGDGGYVVVAAPRIRVLPHGYVRVVINRRVYYRHGAVYYTAVPNGYMVVDRPAEVVTVAPPPPAVTAAPGAPVVAPADRGDAVPPVGAVAGVPVVAPPPSTTALGGVNTLVINVPNKSGSGYTPVTLQRANGGYIGPQGEFYPTMPSVNQLTEMYGGN